MSEWVSDKGKQWSDSGPIKIKKKKCEHKQPMFVLQVLKENQSVQEFKNYK